MRRTKPNNNRTNKHTRTNFSTDTAGVQNQGILRNAIKSETELSASKTQKAKKTKQNKTLALTGQHKMSPPK